MKALCFLLSIWIILCSGTPCADGHVHDDSGKETMAYLHIPVTEQEAGADLCSPFCTCYCCAVTITLPVTSVFFPRPVTLAVIPDMYICPPAADFTAIPWQPPRFSR